MPVLSVLHHSEPTFSESVEQLRQRLHSGGVQAGGSKLNVPEIVRGILSQVEAGGDTAAAKLASELDRAVLTANNLRVPAEVISAAYQKADPSFLALMRKAIANIRAYQEHILIAPPPALERGGRSLGVRYTPIDRVAVYVPGGQALYPSTVLMTVVPAQVAGVREIAMFSPATGGEINAMALALAAELGVQEVYRLGGAVAIAAAAFGTNSIPRVQKVVGPGNAFVAEAKRQLFGRVGIDSIAGPSEVLIVADGSANPAWVAADLLAQAEHNPGSALLVTTSESLSQGVLLELEKQLQTLERQELTRPSLEAFSAILVVKDLNAACSLANLFATEHLQLMTEDNEHCLGQIRHAGAIFVGNHTPVPLGDYFAGPSHVLPTGGTAQCFSPLSCNDFRKASSTIAYTEQALTEDAPLVAAFARREGLTAHARAAEIRVEKA